MNCSPLPGLRSTGTALILLAAGLSPRAALAADDVVVPEVLHSFSTGIPSFETGAIPANDGNFYAVSQRGGGGDGAVVKITPAGVVTVLAAFGDPDGPAPGQHPEGPLAFDGVSKLYGAT